MRYIPLIAALLFHSLLAQAQNPVEVGNVNWGRSYEKALTQSKETGKPIFLLFQEVPGCAGCKQFGQDVLSDPSVVNTIESKFVPLLIHNNKGGYDGQIRKRFKEPAWNYQVVRFLDSEGKDIIPRKDRVWSTSGIMARMSLTLSKWRDSEHARSEAKTARVALCQYCFWTGEMKIGAIDGVITTEAGFIEGREVTLVTYDPNRLSLESLVGKAEEQDVASSVYLDDPSQLPGSRKIVHYRKAPEHDQKRQISGTAFSKLDLTPEQATKVNAYARTHPRKALSYLSEQQLTELKSFSRN